MSISPAAADRLKEAPHLESSNPAPPAEETLRDIYEQYFEVVMADTDEARDLSYRLRYQVYCIENAFEPASENPGERETDPYDVQSEHALLIHRKTNTIAGTTRLIMTGKDGGSLPQPIHDICAPEILAEVTDHIPAVQIGEMSRFAVSKEFRRRAEDKTTLTGGLSQEGEANPRRVIPHISLGLMQATISMAKANDITHLYAVMEPALLRMLRHLGIYFEKLGPVVDYHGRRQPCYCDLDHLLATVWAKNPEVWAVMTDSGRIWPLNTDAPANQRLRHG